MADTAAPVDLTIAEQVARVLCSNAETQKFVEEQAKFRAEALKFFEEQAKLRAEALKFERERALAPLSIGFAGMAAGAALMGAGVALAKLLGV